MRSTSMVCSLSTLPVFFGSGGFEQHDVGFVVGDGSVFDTVRDNRGLAYVGII